MSNKHSDLKVQEFEFKNIPQYSKWENFQRAIYDPDKREFLGRTKKNWSQLLLFYTIFYICLAALFAISMQGLLSTLNDKEPKFKLQDSLIGTNPGLGFRPISKRTEKGSLIWYSLDDGETSTQWVDLVDEFLKPYRVEQHGKNFQVCGDNIPVQNGKVCPVEIQKFGPCTRENNYMYNTTSPCIFLKLNRIFGWEPEFQKSVKKGMPEDLQTLVKTKNESIIWVSCQGESAGDRERIKDFQFFPTHGFPGYYFPYTNTENYLSPIVAVQVVNVEPNVVVNIECRAWAKNIKYSGSENYREGSVRFEILIDKTI